MESYKFIKQKKKFLAIIFLIILLGSIAYIQLQHADTLIKNKKDSYTEIKQAGLWLKENSNQEDIILTVSSPHIKYYSEREVFDIPATEDELESLLSSNQNIRFYMVSVFESHQEWMHSYPQNKNLNPIQIYFLGNTQQPGVIIYGFD